MALLAALVLLVSRRARSGVGSNPRSVAGVASVFSSPDVRGVLASLPAGAGGSISNAEIAAAFDPYVLRLGFFRHDGELRYGITIAGEQPATTTAKQTGLARARWSISRYLPKSKGAANRGSQPFFMLGYVGRGVFLFLLCGLLALIAYYNSPRSQDYAPFEKFMDSESFGVRFLFTALGVRSHPQPWLSVSP
ncbi:hypothetical protein GGR56DRAFT_616857 [Xylariaceae sp. FL0804]|nr:hypothetical protein GGR56DRAFT_616857 [Xylariaceae sp. FL0804]